MILERLPTNLQYPAEYAQILEDSKRLDFTLMCDTKTGLLLRTLAAAKPAGRFLEIGTGTGISTAWILDGLSSDASLVSVELNEAYLEIATKHLQHHKNLRLICSDAVTFIDQIQEKYDYIFADTFPGKFTKRNELLSHLAVGGLYIIDDLIPQKTWPAIGHAEKVAGLIQEMENRTDMKTVFLDWASGLMVCVKTN